MQTSSTLKPGGLATQAPNAPEQGHNYYDGGNGQQHVYDRNWSYLFSQPSMAGSQAKTMGLASLNQSSPGIEPTPIPGTGGGGGNGIGPSSNPIWNPVPIGSIGNAFAGAQGGASGGAWPGTYGGWGQIGTGTVYGSAQPNGTQLAYPTGSYWDSSLNGGQGAWVARAQQSSMGSPGNYPGWQTQLGLAGLGGNTSWNNAMRLV